MRYSDTYLEDGESGAPSQVLKCTDLPQFEACLAQADYFRNDEKLHLRNLCNDRNRCESLITIHTSAVFRNNHRKIILDYSRQRVTGETMEQLFDLADAIGLTARRTALQQGNAINPTQEQKQVLHHVLRMPSFYEPNIPNGRRLVKNVNDMRLRIQEFAFRIRSGEIVSSTNCQFKNFIVVASGGFHFGTECVHEALRYEPNALEAAGKRQLRFVSHADPVNVHQAVQGLSADETMVIIISKDFRNNDNPVMLNARTVLDWMRRHIPKKSEDIFSKQVIGITQDTPDSIQRCKNFAGLSLSSIFPLADFVQARFSVCSAVGVLPLSLQYSYPVMSEFLEGCHDMDKHFFNAPLRDNIPVILGLLGVWNSTFLGYSCRTTIPYCTSLNKFPNFIQHLETESNGKRVAIDGTPLVHGSGEVTFGDVHSPYSLFQLLNQGRVVPADFIGVMESQQPADLPREALSNHDELMSHFFAQPDALAYGKTLVDLIQEGINAPLREHMVFTGNRPSSSLLLTKLDAFAMGQLIALYEHRTAVQGFIWGINSFDQFGIELGSVLASHVRAQLSASRKTGASVQGFNASTSTLLAQYLAYGKPTEKKISARNSF